MRTSALVVRLVVALVAFTPFGIFKVAGAIDLHAQGSEQVVLVLIKDWNSTQGTLYRYEWRTDRWVAGADQQPVAIGKSGAAWGLGLHDTQPGVQKVEGDGRSPAGIFAIGTAFGSEPGARTNLRYQAMTQYDYCIDDAESPLYNRIVDARVVGERAVAKSTEPMRRDIHLNGDHRYQVGFVIEHNPHAMVGKGSCIFAHLWAMPGQTTAGCTAMSDPHLRDLVAWLDERRRPVFVLLPLAEYLRLKHPWRLPDLVGLPVDH